MIEDPFERLPFCYLAAYGYMVDGSPMTRCSGRLIKAHLLPARLIKRHGGNPKDPRAVVFACGGLVGIAAHHGHLDSTRRLKLSREAIPPAVEELAAELGLEPWLTREYGPPTRTGRNLSQGPARF